MKYIQKNRFVLDHWRVMLENVQINPLHACQNLQEITQTKISKKQFFSMTSLKFCFASVASLTFPASYSLMFFYLVDTKILSMSKFRGIFYPTIFFFKKNNSFICLILFFFFNLRFSMIMFYRRCHFSCCMLKKSLSCRV